MTKNDGLSQFAADHAEWFARSAYLLTGDPEKARNMAIRALVTTGRHWTAHRWNRPAETVLSALYRAYLNAPVEPPADFPLAGMSPLGRVAVVAQFHDGLDPNRAAQLLGTWPGALHEETGQVRATHPALFDQDEEPEPPAPTPEPAAPVEPPSQTDSPWVAPGQADDALTATANPWAVLPPPAPQPAPAPSPALVRLAADLPAAVPMDVAQTAPRLVLRRRLVNRSVFTALSLASAGTLVAVTIVALTAIGNNIERAAQQADPEIFDTYPTDLAEEPQPDPLPERIDEPITRAYQGFCNSDDPYDERRPPECAQWRLVGKSGTEWRLDASQAAKEATTVPDVAVSQDGSRVAYLDTQNDYVVRDLATGTVRPFKVRLLATNPGFVSSPNGRYFALNFLQSGADSSMLDFKTGTTEYTAWTLAIRNDGRRVTDEDEPDDDSLSRIRLSGRGFRVDGSLTTDGAALAPDGRTLALVADDERVVTMDTRTGRITKLRPLTGDGAGEIVKVERWLDAGEVVVRTSDEDDEVHLVSVNVRTGKSRALDAGDLEYGDVLGAYAE